MLQMHPKEVDLKLTLSGECLFVVLPSLRLLHPPFLEWIISECVHLCCVLRASQLFRPSAAGSGIPELIGFLNGTFVHHIFNIKTMIAKFLSCALAVSAGLPAGPEGPVIHMG